MGDMSQAQSAATSVISQLRLTSNLFVDLLPDKGRSRSASTLRLEARRSCKMNEVASFVEIPLIAILFLFRTDWEWNYISFRVTAKDVNGRS